jgi:ketosteroid isomerase-like protein
MSLTTVLFQIVALAVAQPDPIEAVAAQERNFASDSTQLGINEAFLKHLSADAWIFRPYPLRAGAWLTKQPHDSTVLQWGPQYVEVSRSGDLAISIGPWRIEGKDKSKQVYGHFMSVWKRDDDGSWKVIADHGIVHSKFDINTAVVARNSNKQITTTLTDNARAHRLLQLEIADDEFRAALQEQGAEKAYSLAITPDALILRQGSIPLAGILPKGLNEGKPGFGTGPRRDAKLSSSGDLGFTVGGDSAADYASRGVYERIWRFDGVAWRLAADVTDSSE